MDFGFWREKKRRTEPSNPVLRKVGKLGYFGILVYYTTIIILFIPNTLIKNEAIKVRIKD